MDLQSKSSRASRTVLMNCIRPKQLHRLELSWARLFALQVVALDYELPAAAPEPNHGSTQLSGRSRRMRPVEEASFRHPNLRQRGKQGQLGKNRLFACNRHVVVWRKPASLVFG